MRKMFKKQFIEETLDNINRGNKLSLVKLIKDTSKTLLTI